MKRIMLFLTSLAIPVSILSMQRDSMLSIPKPTLHQSRPKVPRRRPSQPATPVCEMNDLISFPSESLAPCPNNPPQELFQPPTSLSHLDPLTKACAPSAPVVGPSSSSIQGHETECSQRLVEKMQVLALLIQTTSHKDTKKTLLKVHEDILSLSQQSEADALQALEQELKKTYGNSLSSMMDLATTHMNKKLIDKKNAPQNPFED